MPTLRLSESEIDAILNAAKPILPDRRDAFLHAVADVLQTGGDIIGPGSLFRVIRSLQPAYFDAPNLDGAPDDDEPPHPRRRSNGKYAR